MIEGGVLSNKQHTKKGDFVKRYFLRKILIYLMTFFLAVTIDWMIPRFMPGDPIRNMLTRVSVSSNATAIQMMYDYYSHYLD
jgi:peptide/nickel transport system permease protein